MVDSGAMVGAMHSCMLNLFPSLEQFLVKREEQLIGVGGITCRVIGKLHKVPICLGTTACNAGLFFCNFKGTEGMGYSIILGLDLLGTIDRKAWKVLLKF